MIFLHPHLLWGVPGILIVGLALYAWSRRIRRHRLALFTTFDDTAAILRSRQETGRIVAHALVTLGLAFLVVALARPLVGPKTTDVEREGIDVLVAIDVSKSMLTADLPPRRLEAARSALLRWLRGRSNDRVGLIVFSGDAFLQIPLTSDLSAVATLLEAVHPTGRGGSNLENPLKTAIDVFSRVEGKSRALILVTDGESLEGDPVALATEAFQRHGIRVYTLGVGTTAGGKVPNITQSGIIRSEVRNAYGVAVQSKLDATALRALATAGGGAYYALADSKDALENLQHEQLDKLLRETRVVETTDYDEWFALPLLAGLLCLIAERFAPRLARPRRPSASLLFLFAVFMALAPGVHPVQAAEPDFAHYQSLIQTGQAATALAGLREEAVRRPDDPFTLYNLGVAAYAAKDYAAAVKAFESCLALPDNETRPKAHMQLGNTRVRLGESLLATGDTGGAAVEFERALASYEHPEAKDRGLDKNSQVAGRVYLDTLETVAADQLAAAAKTGDNWTQRRMLQKALGAFQQILARDPKRAGAVHRDAETRALLIGNFVADGRVKMDDAQKTMAAGKFKNAYVPMRESYNLAGAASALDANDPRARSFLAESQTAFSTMLVTQARAEFDDAMKNPKLATRLDQLDSAVARIDEALALVPENQETRDLGTVIRKEIEKAALADGDAQVELADKAKTPAASAVPLTKAISRFQRVLEINADNAHARGQLTVLLPRLADAMMQLGAAELADAKKSIAGDNPPTAAQIRKALAHLGKSDAALSQAATAGADQAKLKPLVEEVHALAEKLQALLEELQGGAPPPPPPAPKPGDQEGNPGEPKEKKSTEDGPPEATAPKTFADIRQVGHGLRQPPPEKDW